MGRNKRALRRICRFLYLRRRLLLCAMLAALVLTAVAVTAFAQENLKGFLKNVSLIDFATGQPVPNDGSLSLSANLELSYQLWDIVVDGSDPQLTTLAFVNPATDEETEIDISKDYELALPEYLTAAFATPIVIKVDDITVATVTKSTDGSEVTLQFAGDLLANIGNIERISAPNFHFGATLNENAIGHRNDIVIDLGVGTPITVHITENTPKPPALTGKACENAAGKAEFDSATGSFHWTVTIAPEVPTTDPDTGDPEYTGGYRFVDTLSNQHAYKDGTFQIQWGSGNPGSGSGQLNTSTAGTIEYTFGAAEYINDTVTITYQTVPVDALFYKDGEMVNPNVTVTNTATLYEPGADGEAINSKTGTAKYNGKDWLIKTGGAIDRLNKTIEWTLTIDTNGRGFEEINVYDSIVSTDLTYIPETFDCPDATANGGFTGRGGDVTVEANRLCTIKPEDKETYTITYKTQFDDDLEHNEPLEMENKAWLTFTWATGHGPEGGGVFPIPSVNKPVLLNTSIIAKEGEYEPNTTRIKWTVTVNANRLNITRADITDIITLTNQTDVLTDPAPAAVCKNDATVAYAVDMQQSGTPGVYDVVLNKTGGGDNVLGTDTVEIVYYTKASDPAFYANNATAVFENTAGIENILIADAGGTRALDGEYEAAADPTGTSRVLDKANGRYNYNTKRITWTLTVNENAMALTDAVVTDALPSYLTFVAGSDRYTPAFTPRTRAAVSADNVLTIDLGTVSDKLTVTFETDLDVNATTLPGGFRFGANNTAANAANVLALTNEASLTTHEYSGGVVTESGEVTINNMLLTKTGSQPAGQAGQVNYRLELNQNGADLAQADPNGAILTDELPNNLFVDLADVHLFSATVHPTTGAFIQGAEVSLNYSQKMIVPPNSLQVTLPAAVADKPCILTYSAYIISASSGDVSLTNKAGFGPDGGTGGDEITTVARAGSGGGATSIPGKSALTVTMVDDGDPPQPLAGAVFGLYAPVPGSTTGETYLFATATTALDANGDATATFIGLTPGETYTLVELTAPAGYVPGAPITVVAGTVGRIVPLTVVGTKRIDAAFGSDGAEAVIPHTGDDGLPWLWAGLTVLSAAGLCISRKRRAA